MGSMYEEGKGVEKDLTKAVEWYQKSAEQGDAEGQWRLGVMYEEGEGVEKDLAKAAEWYQKSAEQGNSIGKWALGHICAFNKDVAEGMGLGNGERIGIWRLGNMEEILDIAEDVTTDVNFWEPWAEEGDADAQWHLGCIYGNGEGVQKNLSKAEEWYQKSAEQGDSTYQWLLGSMYECGEIVEKNFSKAVEWYQKSAEQGDAEGQWRLGSMYENGEGVEKDLAKAVEWYQKSAEQGDSNGQYHLGYAYYDGFGVERDLTKAKEFFEKALQQGYNCAYALSMVKSELGEEDTHNAMREYADALLEKHLPSDKIYPQISKDLQTDFGETWKMTTRDTKKFLETGIFTYFSLYSLGPHIYGNMDFSASITPMFKALEKELGKYLYSGYIEYLKAQDVSPNSFSGRRTFLNRIGENEYVFKNPSDVDAFTLGSLHLTVGMLTHHSERKGEKAKTSIDASMLSYLQKLLKKEAFGADKREREITNYIISLTREVKSIADSFRNPAAHANAMECQRAEVCGNYIIKVRRLLIDFLEKIK